MRYQNRVTVEGTVSRFSVYPFPPPLVDSKVSNNEIDLII